MAGTKLLLLQDKRDILPGKCLLYLIGLMANHHDGLAAAELFCQLNRKSG